MTGSNSRPQEIEALCREAVKCRACFDHGALTSATIDIAQPRWIGDGYWTSSPRVCVVMFGSRRWRELQRGGEPADADFVAALPFRRNRS